MNNYCRELNFTPELYPKLDFSKYNTDGYDWSTFHKTPSPSELNNNCLLYTSPSPRDTEVSRMPSSA